MAPSSQLAIATGSVSRLVKEETSYHKELKQQETRLEKLLASTEENENAEYQQKQEASLTLPCHLNSFHKSYAVRGKRRFNAALKNSPWTTPQ
jgi:septal ring factor EnvC (AmiA/AmiB activator)